MEEKKKSMCNACYKCIHRGTIPGNAHSRCKSPKVKNGSIEITGDKYGSSQGWFFFPFNFDPTWLVSCNGFEEKPEAPTDD